MTLIVAIITAVMGFISIKYNFAYEWVFKMIPFLILNGLIINYARKRSNLEGSTWIHLLWSLPLGIVFYINPYYFILVLITVVVIFGIVGVTIGVLSAKEGSQISLRSLRSEKMIPESNFFIDS